MSKKRVAIVRGGPSMEHEISLLSAESVVQNLDRNQYDVVDCFVAKDGTWSIDRAQPINDEQAIIQLKDKVDVVFLAVHGTYGEDGVLQEKLERAGIPFTGSGSKASALAMNKTQAQEVLQKSGMKVPAWQTITSSNEEVDVELPIVVKPVSQGSSVGVSIVREDSQLQAAIEEAFKHDSTVMLQQYIKGREVSCGVLELPDSNDLQKLPPTELIPKNTDFFDYKAKYTAGETDEITPPNMPKEIIEQIQEYAVKAHQVLGCKGYSRTDMIVRDNEIFIIETNTLPGMTKTSILPQQAAAAGITFPELLDRIIASAK